MSTATTASSAAATAGAGTGGTTALRVLRSEWLKLVTVRSTYWTTAVALLLAAAPAALVGLVSDPDPSAATASAGTAATIGLVFVALVVGVLGVLAIGGEYTTLQIRSSYAAVPKRWPALVAKGAVVAAWSFVLGLVVTFGGYGITAAIFASRGLAAPLDGATAGTLLGGAAYLAVVGAFGVGLGALVRVTAAGITVLSALLFVAPIVLQLLAVLLRAEWVGTASDYLLSNAGSVLSARAGSASIELWAAILALVCWLAAVWLPALALTRARDV